MRALTKIIYDFTMLWFLEVYSALYLYKIYLWINFTKLRGMRIGCFIIPRPSIEWPLISMKTIGNQLLGSSSSTKRRRQVRDGSFGTNVWDQCGTNEEFIKKKVFFIDQNFRKVIKICLLLLDYTMIAA